MHRNNSISSLIWIQVHGDSIFCLFEVKFLAQITFRVNAFSPPSFCSTWSCHSTAFIFPAVSFSFSVFPLNLQQLSSQSETLTWKRDDFRSWSRLAASATPLPIVQHREGWTATYGRKLGSELSPKGLNGYPGEAGLSREQSLVLSVPVASPFQEAPDLGGMMNPRAAVW